MSKKKVLYIHHGKGLGGAPLSLLYLIEGLDKSLYEPVVLFLYDSEVMEMYRAKGIEVLGPVNRSDFAHTKIWWYRWYHAHHLLRAIRDTFFVVHKDARYWLENIKPDLVHLNTSSLVAWGIVARKMGIPVVWHIREPLASGYLGLRKLFVKKMVEQYATRIVPICKNDAKPWIQNAKTQVVYNAVQPQLFDKNIDSTNFLKAHSIPERAPKILFLGGLSKEKGTLLLFEIFEKVLEQLPQAQLLVAGNFDFDAISKAQNLRAGFASYFPTARFYANVGKQLQKIKQNVVFLGSIRNVPEAMAASDVIVFPATVGHFARPIIEAGFMAKPVVASKLAPLDELVVDSKTGFLVDPNDKKAWVKVLVEVLQNKVLQKSLGENAFSWCSANFGIAEQVKSIAKLYETL